MKSISYQNFFHSHFDDLPLSDDVLFGKIFLPEDHHYLIDDAKSCNLEAVQSLKEMFTYGTKGATPNFDVAKRYWYALHSHAEITCCKSTISFSLDDYAYLLEVFNRPLEHQAEAYAFAISYMTSELPLEHWDIPVLQKHLARLEEISHLLDQE
jgi:hypothetical protein